MSQRISLILLFFGVVIISALVMLPLSLAVRLSGVAIQAERISGTVWNGRIEKAWVTGYPVGDVDVNGHFLPLLKGTLVADLNVRGALVTGQGQVTASPNRLRFEDTDLVVDLAATNFRDALGSPMAGQVIATVPNLSLNREGCVSGSAKVSTNTLRSSARRYGGQGFDLTGQGRCQDGLFILPITGEGPEGRVNINVQISAQGYTTTMVVEPRLAELAEALQIYGFQKEGTAYSLIQRGEIF